MLDRSWRRSWFIDWSSPRSLSQSLPLRRFPRAEAVDRSEASARGARPPSPGPRRPLPGAAPRTMTGTGSQRSLGYGQRAAMGPTVSQRSTAAARAASPSTGVPGTATRAASPARAAAAAAPMGAAQSQRSALGGPQERPGARCPVLRPEASVRAVGLSGGPARAAVAARISSLVRAVFRPPRPPGSSAAAPAPRPRVESGGQVDLRRVCRPPPPAMQSYHVARKLPSERARVSVTLDLQHCRRLWCASACHTLCAGSAMW